MWETRCGTEIIFLASSLAAFLSGLGLILLLRAIQWCFMQWFKHGTLSAPSATIPSKIKRKLNNLRYHMIYVVEMLLSAQTYGGRVLAILVFFLSIGTVIIYLIMSSDPLDFCDYSGKSIQVADLALNMFFAFHFGLRFIAADSKLRFWLELNSFVDFFTIPPVCVSFIIGKNWLGLRFLRALRLLALHKILQLLRITKTSTSIKLCKLLSVFLSVWLTAAGFIHLLENSGDPWVKPVNNQTLSYFECIYLLMVTMSTVGYGDITAKTNVGRFFMIFFIAGGLVLFASHVPEILEIVGSLKNHNGIHVIMAGRKHIVVCGHITLDSVTSFLKDFLHKDRGENNTEILFMEAIQPNLELGAVFKCHNLQTSFFYGSVLNCKDLNRVKMESADACLVLADKNSTDPEREDASNIMRVISVKTYYPKTRVIIQILQSKSKFYLQNIPCWDWRAGDSIICLAELKLGFMAKSCLVPGLSTLLTNLCSMKYDAQVKRDSWQWNFVDGTNNYLMTETLSSDFVGMSFWEVCSLCFDKLNIVLMAIEYRFASGISILVNPSDQIALHENTVGFFIARSAAEVKRASLYCRACHDDIHDPSLIKQCSCNHKALLFSKLVPGYSLLKPEKSRSLGVLPLSVCRYDTTSPEDNVSHPVLDSTGMFHWCTAVPLEQALLTHKVAARSDFHDHIVVSIFGSASSTLIGLRDFIMPLRTSNITYADLKPIVFLGPLKYLKREWKDIQNFPKLFVLPGSGLSCANLRAVGIYKCSMCAVLSSNGSCDCKQYLEDTECILATLNLRSMQFKGRVNNAAARCLSDRQTEPAARIPVITELKKESNIIFIQQDMPTSSQCPHTKAYLTTAFASGSVFSGCFLDSLTTMTYFNCQVLALLQTLATGGTTPELEEQLSEENELASSSSKTKNSFPRDRCKLSLIPLTDHRLFPLNGNTYGDFFYKALTSLGIICFGIYRLMDPPNHCHIRYVITRPPKHFLLLATDLMYCVVPYREQSSILDSSKKPMELSSSSSSEDQIQSCNLSVSLSMKE